MKVMDSEPVVHSQQGTSGVTSITTPGGSTITIEAQPRPGVGVCLLVDGAAQAAAHDVAAAPPDQPLLSPRDRDVLAGWLQRSRSGALAWLGAVPALITWPNVLLAGALLVYLVTRFVRLPDFPIYFFTDEAIQTLLAQDLLRHDLRGYDGILLPTFFQNEYQYNLGTSVYAQVLPYLLFGKTVWATRGVSVLITLLGAAAVGLTLKDIFKSAYAWGAVLLLSITPAWFLHSRTAFETAIATTFFAVFIYFYLLYRTRSPRFLPLALISGALVFYSYSPARMVAAVAAFLLLFSDIRYHWQQRRVFLSYLWLIALLIAPFVRFMIEHPDANTHHLQVLSSYWIADMPFTQKLGIYFKEYTHGLSPLYWFLPNNTDLPRHLMRGYGHIMPWTFPLLLTGLGACLWNLQSAKHRVLIIALLAGPSGAALAAIGITRALATVVPAALLSALGLSLLLDWLRERIRLPALLVGMPVFIGLVFVNVWMLRDALDNGPVWYDDYGLGGMQWGGNQIFDEIDAFRAQHPDVQVILSPTWANGTDIVARFFYDEGIPFAIGSIEGFYYRKGDLTDKMVFVMTPQEYQGVQESGKFTDISAEKVVKYPNGLPGFYFVRLRYADNIDEILDAEIARRSVLQETDVVIGGQPARLFFSYLDMGDPHHLFDDDDFTLVRTMEANPFKAHMTFDAPVEISGLEVRVGGVASQVDVTLFDQTGEMMMSDQIVVKADPNPRTLVFDWGSPYLASRINVEVLSVNDGEPAHVHVWEIRLR